MDAGVAIGALPLLAAWTGELGYAVWLIVVVSLVYTATRHERLSAILDHAWRFALKVVGLLLVVGLLVWLAAPGRWGFAMTLIACILVVVFWQSLVRLAQEIAHGLGLWNPQAEAPVDKAPR
jgi:hypothetical protein